MILIKSQKINIWHANSTLGNVDHIPFSLHNVPPLLDATISDKNDNQIPVNSVIYFVDQSQPQSHPLCYQCIWQIHKATLYLAVNYIASIFPCYILFNNQFFYVSVTNKLLCFSHWLNKAICSDGLSGNIIMDVYDSIKVILFKVFKASLKEAVFPEKRKIAKVI